jgi:hypothetical protein
MSLSSDRRELARFPIWLLLVFAFGRGLVVSAFVIFAIRKTPEAHDLTRLWF